MKPVAMINLFEEQTSTLHQKKSSKTPEGNFIAHNPNGSEIEEYTVDLRRWLHIIQCWEKEGRLILKLVSFATLGQENEPDLDSSVDHLKRLFQTEIEDLKKELFGEEWGSQQIGIYGLHYKRRFQQLKKQMNTVSNIYRQRKYDVFEELIRCLPLTII